MQEKGLSCNKQSYQANKYHTIKVLSSIRESESCWSEQAIKWSSKAIKHVKIANQTSKQIESPCLKRRYPLIDQLNATFSSTSVQAWSSKSPTESPICGPAFFTCVPTRSARLVFFFLKNNFWKSRSRHLFYFYFWRENKTRNKNPKMWLHSFWKKHVFEKPESMSGDQVTYWEGTFKR